MEPLARRRMNISRAMTSFSTPRSAPELLASVGVVIRVVGSPTARRKDGRTEGAGERATARCLVAVEGTGIAVPRYIYGRREEPGYEGKGMDWNE